MNSIEILQEAVSQPLKRIDVNGSEQLFTSGGKVGQNSSPVERENLNFLNKYEFKASLNTSKARVKLGFLGVSIFVIQMLITAIILQISFVRFRIDVRYVAPVVIASRCVLSYFACLFFWSLIFMYIGASKNSMSHFFLVVIVLLSQLALSEAAIERPKMVLFSWLQTIFLIFFMLVTVVFFETGTARSKVKKMIRRTMEFYSDDDDDRPKIKRTVSFGSLSKSSIASFILALFGLTMRTNLGSFEPHDDGEETYHEFSIVPYQNFDQESDVVKALVGVVPPPFAITQSDVVNLGALILGFVCDVKQTHLSDKILAISTRTYAYISYYLKGCQISEFYSAISSLIGCDFVPHSDDFPVTWSERLSEFISGPSCATSGKAIMVLLTTVPILQKISWNKLDVVRVVKECSISFKGVDLATEVMQAFKCIISDMLILITGVDAKSVANLNKMYSEAEVASRLIENRMPQDMSLQDAKILIKRAQKAFEIELRKYSLSSMIGAQVATRLTKLKGWEHDLDQCIQFSKRREKPFTIAFVGESGTGKSTSMSTIIDLLHEYYGISDIAKPALVGCFERYMSTLHNDTTSVVFDELMNMTKDLITADSNPMINLHAVTGTESIPINKADVESKGKVVFTGKFVGACSNFTTFNAHFLTKEPIAFIRRLEPVYFVSIVEEVKSSTGVVNIELAQEYESRHGTGLPLPCWQRFQRIHYTKSPNGVGVEIKYGPTLTVEQFLKEFYGHCDSHKAEVNRLKTKKVYEFCKHSKVLGACIECFDPHSSEEAIEEVSPDVLLKKEKEPGIGSFKLLVLQIFVRSWWIRNLRTDYEFLVLLFLAISFALNRIGVYRWSFTFSTIGLLFYFAFVVWLRCQALLRYPYDRSVQILTGLVSFDWSNVLAFSAGSIVGYKFGQRKGDVSLDKLVTLLGRFSQHDISEEEFHELSKMAPCFQSLGPAPARDLFRKIESKQYFGEASRESIPIVSIPSSTTTVSNLSNLAIGNMYFFTMKSSNLQKSITKKGSMLFIKPGYALLPKHYLVEGYDLFHFEIRKSAKNKFKVRLEFQLHRNSVYEVSGDLLVIKASIGNVPIDLTPYFLDSHLEVSGLVSNWIRRDEKGEVDQQSIAIEGPRTCTHVYDFEGYYYSFSEHASQRGFCGAAIVSRVHNSSVIVAIHVAGSTAGLPEGLGSILRKERVLEAINYIRDNSGGQYGLEFVPDGMDKGADMHPKHPLAGGVPEGFSGLVVGTGSVNNTPKSHIRVSPLFPNLLEVIGVGPTKVLPIIRGKQNHADGMFQAGGPVTDYDPKIVSMAIEDYLQGHEVYVEECRSVGMLMRPMTVLEAINGISPGMFGINKATSAGPPFFKKKSAFLVEIGEQQFDFTDEVKQMMQSIISNYTSGKRSGWSFEACLKDETKKLSKQDNIRQFYCANMCVATLHYMFSGPIQKVIEAHPQFFETMSGIDPLSKDYHAMWFRLSAISSDYVLCGDYKKMDKTIPTFCKAATRDVYLKIALTMGYTEDSLIFLQKLWDELINPTVRVLGVLVSLPRLSPSGTQETVHVNGIGGNSILLRIAAEEYSQLLTKCQKEGVNSREFMAITTMGDDVKASVCNKTILNNNYLSEFADKIGMVYTSPDKDSALQPFYTMENSEICKRKDYYNPDMGYVCGALDRRGIIDAYYYTSGSNHLEEEKTRIIDICNCDRIESVPYGREYYEKTQEQCKRICSEVCGVLPPSFLKVSYDDAILDLGSRSGYEPHGGNVVDTKAATGTSSKDKLVPSIKTSVSESVDMPKSKTDNRVAKAGKEKEAEGEALGPVTIEPVLEKLPTRIDEVIVTRAETTGFDKFLSREILIFNTKKNPDLDLKIQLNCYDLWLKHRAVYPKLEGYAYMCMPLNVRVEVNCTPGHYGTLCVSALPGYDCGIKRAFDKATGDLAISIAFESPGVYLSLPEVVTAKLELPTFTMNPNLSLFDFSSGSLSNIPCVLTIMNVTPIKHFQEKDESYSIQVYAWAEPGSFCGATAFEPHSGDEARGVISNVLSVSAKAVDFLYTHRLSLQTLASVLGKASEHAWMLGFSKPLNLTYHSAKSDEIGLMSVTNCSEIVHPMKLDAQGEVGLGGVCQTDDIDELSFGHILDNFSYVGQISWGVELPSKSVLLRLPVAPYYLVGSPDFCRLTRSGHVANCFSRWHGSVEFEISIVCSKYHSGCLTIAHEPLGAVDPLKPHLLNKTRFDIKKQKNVTLRVHWASGSSMLKCPRRDKTPVGFVDDFVDLDYHNGELAVIIEAPLTSNSATGTAPVTVAVRMRLDSDCSFMTPRNPWEGYSAILGLMNAPYKPPKPTIGSRDCNSVPTSAPVSFPPVAPTPVQAPSLQPTINVGPTVRATTLAPAGRNLRDCTDYDNKYVPFQESNKNYYACKKCCHPGILQGYKSNCAGVDYTTCPTFDPLLPGPKAAPIGTVMPSSSPEPTYMLKFGTNEPTVKGVYCQSVLRKVSPLMIGGLRFEVDVASRKEPSVYNFESEITYDLPVMVAPGESFSFKLEVLSSGTGSLKVNYLGQNQSDPLEHGVNTYVYTYVRSNVYSDPRWVTFAFLGAGDFTVVSVFSTIPAGKEVIFKHVSEFTAIGDVDLLDHASGDPGDKNGQYNTSFCSAAGWYGAVYTGKAIFFAPLGISTREYGTQLLSKDCFRTASTMTGPNGLIIYGDYRLNEPVTVGYYGFYFLKDIAVAPFTPHNTDSPSIASEVTSPSIWTMPTIFGTHQPTPAPHNVLTETANPVVLKVFDLTEVPSKWPSNEPSFEPSEHLSVSPSVSPSESPSMEPSPEPSLSPSSEPSVEPSFSPTGEPSGIPSLVPSFFPSLFPSRVPSVEPSEDPSSKPSEKPSFRPTKKPTSKPTKKPTSKPTWKPTSKPTTKPTPKPTSKPTAKPTKKPTNKPTKKPTKAPTYAPTINPATVTYTHTGTEILQEPKNLVGGVYQSANWISTVSVPIWVDANGGRFQLTVSVDVGSSATLTLPDSSTRTYGPFTSGTLVVALTIPITMVSAWPTKGTTSVTLRGLFKVLDLSVTIPTNYILYRYTFAVPQSGTVTFSGMPYGSVAAYNNGRYAFLYKKSSMISVSYGAGAFAVSATSTDPIIAYLVFGPPGFVPHGSVEDIGQKHNSNELIRLAFSGESVGSLRSLLKRTEFWDEFDVKPGISVYGSVLPGSRLYPTPSVLEWIQNSYLGVRGGYRHKFIVSSSKPGSVTFYHVTEDGTTTSEEVLAVNGISSITLDFPYYSHRKFAIRSADSLSQWFLVPTTEVHVLHYVTAAEDFNSVYYFGSPFMFVDPPPSL